MSTDDIINLHNERLKNVLATSIKVKAEIAEIARIGKKFGLNVDEDTDTGSVEDAESVEDTGSDITKQVANIDVDAIARTIDTANAVIIEKLYKIVKDARKKFATHKLIQTNAKELAPIICGFRAHFCEDTDPDSGQCKVEFETTFKNGCVLILRFVINYLLIKEGKKQYYDFGKKSGNKIEKTVLLFDATGGKTGRGPKLHDFADFDKEQLNDVYNNIFSKNNSNNNSYNIKLINGFLRKMVCENIPKSKYFGSDMGEVLSEMICG